MKICQIVGAGDFSRERFIRYDGSFLIAADKGFQNLSDCGIPPDLLIGDFDSLGYVPDFPNIIRYPLEKDETDMALAINSGLENNCDLFLLYGALGGRLDHSLSNLQLLSFLSKMGKQCFIIDKELTAAAVTDGRLDFSENSTGTVSVFALGEKAEGVCLKGLKYPLCDAVLTPDRPLGVSNAFLGQRASVSVKSGTLSVLWHGPLDNCLSL